jgi:hypothetical protein
MSRQGGMNGARASSRIGISDRIYHALVRTTHFESSYEELGPLTHPNAHQICP